MGEGLHLFEELSVALKEIPYAVLAQYSAFQVGRKESPFIVGKVFAPVVAAQVGGEHGDGRLCGLVGEKGILELFDGLGGLVETLLHFAYS